MSKKNKVTVPGVTEELDDQQNAEEQAVVEAKAEEEAAAAVAAAGAKAEEEAAAAVAAAGTKAKAKTPTSKVSKVEADIMRRMQVKVLYKNSRGEYFTNKNFAELSEKGDAKKITVIQ
jgi:hypothetical protein